MGCLPPHSDAYSRFAAKLSEVEDDLARLRGARERMVATGVKAAAIHAERAGHIVTQSSEDGAATVHCDGHGKVVSVEFDAALYRANDDRDLCTSVLRARQRARATALDSSSSPGKA